MVSELTKNDELIVEGYKLSSASFRHITSLNVSAILILGAFLKDQFPNPELKFIIPWIFGLFILSTICSVLTIKVNIMMIQKSPNIEKWIRNFGALNYLIAVLSFILGLTFLSTFVVVNWV